MSIVKAVVVMTTQNSCIGILFCVSRELYSVKCNGQQESDLCWSGML